MYKINRADPLTVQIETAKYYQDKVIRPLTKAFTDPSHDDFKLCHPYAPLLSWANQYCNLVIEAHQEKNMEDSIQKKLKELAQKEEKKEYILKSLDNFNKENLIGHL